MKPLVGLVAACLLLSQTSDASQLYRFKVDGKTFIEHHIPPQYADYGYEVINNRGIVVEVVPAAPTKEELEAMAAQKAADEARQKARLKQKEDDIALLHLYAHPSDVERARTRKALELDSYIQLQRRNIDDLVLKLEAEQKRAANIERNGRDVPADMRANIIQLQNGIKDSERNISQRQQLMNELTQEMAQQYERVRILQVYKPGVLPSEVDYDHVDRVLDQQQAQP